MSSDAPQTWYADETTGEADLAATERYTLHEELGRGGFGRVVRAWDHALDREVALKEVRVDAPPAMVRRFLGEAKLTARLEHPNIVPIHDAGERADGTLYYVMRLVRGRSLHDALHEADGLAGRLRLLSHFEDVCQAMAYAHGKGVLHRDLKPANVMLGEHGETLVVDWGIARLLEREATGAVEGTPAYMSPEQARGEPLDPRSDVWSLGATLFELLSGVPPFHGADPATLLERVRTEPPPRLHSVAPEAPAELAAIVDKALSVARADRYRSAADLALDVSAWRDGRRVDAYRYRPREVIALFVRQHRLPLGALAVGLVVAVVVASGAVVRVMAARDRAMAAESSLSAALGEALTRNARDEIEGGNTTSGALLAAEAIRLADAPAARGWLALSLGAAPWRHARTRGDGPCTDAAASDEWTWCVHEGVVTGASTAGARWRVELPGAWRMEASPVGDALVVVTPREWALLDATTGAVELREPATRPGQVGWSPAGERFAVAAIGALTVHDRRGALLFRHASTSTIPGLQLEADGSLQFATASGWLSRVAPAPSPDDAAPGTLPGTRTVSWCAPRRSALAVAFHPTESLVAIVGFDRTVSLLDPATCALVAEAPLGTDRVRTLTWVPALDLLVGGDEQGGLTTWTRRLDRRDVVQVGSPEVPRPHPLPDGVLVGTRAGATRLTWSPDRRAPSLQVPGGPSAAVGTAAGLWVAVGSELHLLDPTDGREVDAVDLGAPIRGLTRIPDGIASYAPPLVYLHRPGADAVVELGAGEILREQPFLGVLEVVRGDTLTLVDPATLATRDVATGGMTFGLVDAPGGWWVRPVDGGEWYSVAADGARAPLPATADLVDAAFSPGAARRAELRHGVVVVDGAPGFAVPEGSLSVRWFGDAWLATYTSDAWYVYRPDGALVAILPGHAGRVVAEALDRRRLLTTSWDGEVRQWNLEALEAQADTLAAALRVAFGARVDGASVLFDPM